jgi:long-chain acyl-CoA synthetase
MASMITETCQSIAGFFARAVASRPNEPALGFVRNGALHWRTWQDVADAAGSLAAELQAAGIAPGDRVAQVSENRYEWIITDLALHFAAAVHVPIHVTLSGQQIAEQIRDSGAKLVFVSNEDLLSRFATYLDKQLSIRRHDDHRIAGELRLAGAPAKPQAITSIDCDRAIPAALATILYTSGTTGCPRGVMLSHENLASNAAAVCEAHQVNADHTMLCILPLSHIYARTCDLYTWVVSGSRLVLGESRETLLRDCQLVQPTALNAVPFVYQRIMDGICNSTAIDKRAALRAAFGGRMETLFCGGAPVAPGVETWYADQGLPLLPGYGLTEASPVIAVTTRHARRLGTVGQAIPGIENRIAPDGELLTRGPHVMLGYWQNAVATAEAIEDGWLRTGDLAELDADGFLTIRGRKKELIVLSTGKKVSPTRVESLLTASPLIDQAAVFGDGQCGLTALIVPATRSLAKSEERGARSESFRQEIDRCLAHAAHEEQIHRFTLLDRPFSIDRGELTAKMSLCRSVIARNFAAELNANSPPSTS